MFRAVVILGAKWQIVAISNEGIVREKLSLQRNAGNN